MFNYRSLLLTLLLPVVSFAQPSWDFHLVTSDLNGPITTHAVDMDSDGDMDVIGTGQYNHRVVWVEQDNDAWITHIIDPFFERTRSVYPADMDLDGDMDVIATAFAIDEIAWYEQTDVAWVKHVLTVDFDAPIYAIGVDLDLDGDMDIVATAFLGNTIAWWENTTEGWVYHEVTTDFEGAFGINAGDIDGDGDIDLVGCSARGNEIAWFENDNLSWIEHILSDRMNSARSVSADDMDGDGDLDIVGTAAKGDKIAWWENRDGVFFQHMISSSFANARLAKVIDLDLDGDVDILASSLWQDEVSWFENTGITWTKHLISNNCTTAKGIDAADMDNDGDIDVVAVSFQDDRIYFCEQLPEQNPDDITITVVPTEYPIIVPRDSSIVIDIEIHFVGLHQQTYKIWTERMLPNGLIEGLSENSVFIESDETIMLNQASYTIPNDAPLGEYEWIINVGYSVNHAIVSSSFRFTVTLDADVNSESSYQSWGIDGSQIAAAIEESQTRTENPITENRFGSAFPNPFNEMVTIPLSLKNTENVCISVHNTLGQRVAELQNGILAGGSYQFSLSTSNLASGLYFVRAEIGEYPAQTQKLMLLR